MYASKCSHSLVGMTSSTNNIEYDVNGIQSGECGIIFSSTITDIVSPLQTGGQSQNLNSMTGSLERGNKGAICEGKKEIKWSTMNFGTEEKSKCGICGTAEPGYWKNGELMEDIVCNQCALTWKYDCDDNTYKRKKKFRDSKPKTQKQCIKCDSPAVFHAFCVDWCQQCYDAPIGEQPATFRDERQEQFLETFANILEQHGMI